MISNGRVAEQEALLNSRKYKQHSDIVTLGKVVNRLNSASEKIATINLKKTAILESLRRASRHEFIAREEARDSLFDLKSMTKSLQTQLKFEGHKKSCCEGRGKRSTRKCSGPVRALSAVSLGRLSSAPSRSGFVVKIIDTERNHKAEEASSRTQGNKIYNAQSIYSRHTNNVKSNVRETTQLDFTEQSRKNSFRNADITVKIEPPATESDESKSNSESSKETLQKVFHCNERVNSAKRETRSPQKSISSKEKEVLNTLTDPQLKESLQNIIKRRRSSVRFVKCDSGYEVVNLEKAICEQVEEDPEEFDDRKNLAGTKSTPEDEANSDTNGNKKSGPSRRDLVGRELLPSATTSTSGSFPTGGVWSQTRALGKMAPYEMESFPMRGVYSTRSCQSAASVRSFSSPILRNRKSELKISETRVIRPATARSYVPNLTNRKVCQKQSILSFPEMLMRKEQAKNLAEVKMIREFLLMYAKVTTKNKLDTKLRQPVRMMSETPELVIKSAIGKFLTRAFPSGETQERNGLSAKSNKESFEEQQRSKLLRIKICMEHLAAVA